MDCTILQGDAMEMLRTLPPESVHTCVTSPPYYNLRDYGVEGQIGKEASVEEYLQSLVSVFREVRRVLHGGPSGALPAAASVFRHGHDARSVSIFCGVFSGFNWKPKSQ